MPGKHTPKEQSPAIPTAEMDSVTALIADIGNEESVNKLVQRYFDKLLRFARGKYQRTFGNIPRPVADEEDAVISALKSFWKRLTTKGFDRLRNRNDLWQILVIITIRKIY